MSCGCKPQPEESCSSTKPIPAFTEPFSRVMIHVDCVGPLPQIKAGNQYLLTITGMCTLTHFLEAIPLKNIKMKTIVKVLYMFWSPTGYSVTPRFQFYICLVFPSKCCTSWESAVQSTIPGSSRAIPLDI